MKLLYKLLYKMLKHIKNDYMPIMEKKKPIFDKLIEFKKQLKKFQEEINNQVELEKQLKEFQEQEYC